MDKTKQMPPGDTGGEGQLDSIVSELHLHYITSENENQYSNCLEDMITLARRRGDTAILKALLELAAKWGGNG